MYFLPNTSKMMQEAHFVSCYRIPQVHPIPHLHDLCCTVPTAKLPVDLHLASRVYHTPDRTGHKSLLRFLKTSVLGGHSMDDQRDR